MCSKEDDPSMHDEEEDNSCPICGEEPEWQHCPECHKAAVENRPAHGIDTQLL